MSRDHHHWLTLLYPASWRERYGDEMDDMLRGGCGFRDALDVAKAALVERMFYSSRTGVQTVQTYPGSIAIFARKPSAIVPVIMSVGALAVVLIAVLTGGVKPRPDEYAAAHIWQLLMVGQLPFLGWFALRWLRRDFRSAVPVVGLQILAFGLALLPVWLLGL